MTISVRLSGRVEHDPEKSLVIGGGPATNRDDSTDIRHSPGRLSSADADRILHRLAETDGRIIEILGATRYATGKQIRRLLWEDSEPGRRLGRYHMNKLNDLRVVTRLDRRIGGARAGSDGYVYALDVVGQRHLDRGTRSPRRPQTPSAAFIDHTLAITDIYIELRAHDADQTIELIGFATEPEAWRRFRSAGRSHVLKPDAYAEWNDPEWEHAAFFEVDRGTEHPGRISRKAESYVRYWSTDTEQDTSGFFPRVLWVGPDDRRCDQLRDAIETIDSPADLFEVTTHEGFARSLTSTNQHRKEVNQ